MPSRIIMLIEALRNRWENLILDYPINHKDSISIFQEIISAYIQPHRSYHNLNHLNHLFQELDSCGSISNEMQWAVWYHDYVYKPGSKTNEKRSAKKAELIMFKLGIPQSNIDKVISLIMATENHQFSVNDSDIQFFLDADMAILGSDRLTYLEYCKAIRQEYSTIPDFLFNRGRKKFLSNILKQRSIFLSSFFRDKYEQDARINIIIELSGVF